MIIPRQYRCLGHVLRKNELEAISLTGKIEGKRARGRQRKMFLDCGLGVFCMWKPMERSRDSEAVPETRGAPVDRQRQILIRHYNRTGLVSSFIRWQIMEGGSQNLKSRSRDLATPILGLFSIHRPLCSNRHGRSSKEKTKCLISSIQKLPEYQEFQNWKKRLRDPGHAPFGVIHRPFVVITSSPRSI